MNSVLVACMDYSIRLDRNLANRKPKLAKYICIYIYMYRERETQRERARQRETERERQSGRERP